MEGSNRREENRMPLHFRLNEFGRAFATRGRGTELREELVTRAEQSDIVVIDFEGVTNVSYSFADEFAGKLAAETPLRVEPANMTAGVARTVESAIRRRAGDALAC
jgi:hypothetical protein